MGGVFFAEGSLLPAIRGKIHNLFMWYKMCSAQYDRLCDIKYACSIVDDIHCIVYSTLIILYYSVKST